MKRVRSIGAALAVLALAGCASIRANSKQEFTPIHPGQLTVATTLPAPGFWNQDAKGDFTGGFEYEVANALADRFGLELKVVDVPFDDLTTGKFDDADIAMSQISITDERADHVDFSTSYYTTSAGVLARHGKTIADLKTAREQTWCVTDGTTGSDLVDDVVKPTSDKVVEQDDPACAQAVIDGTADAALVDVASAIALQGVFPELDTVARFVTDERYGVAVRNGDRNLEAIDAGLHAMNSDGSLREFADAWLDTSIDPNKIPVIVTKSP